MEDHKDMKQHKLMNRLNSAARRSFEVHRIKEPPKPKKDEYVPYYEERPRLYLPLNAAPFVDKLAVEDEIIIAFCGKVKSVDVREEDGKIRGQVTVELHEIAEI